MRQEFAVVLKNDKPFTPLLIESHAAERHSCS